jgi:hypothetical protein
MVRNAGSALLKRPPTRLDQVRDAWRIAVGSAKATAR